MRVAPAHLWAAAAVLIASIVLAIAVNVVLGVLLALAPGWLVVGSRRQRERSSSPGQGY